MWGSIASKLPRHEPERHLLAYGNHRLEVLMYDLLTRKALGDAFRPTSTVLYKFRLTNWHRKPTQNNRGHCLDLTTIPTKDADHDGDYHFRILLMRHVPKVGLKPYMYMPWRRQKTTLNTQLARGHGRHISTNISWMKTLFDQQYLARRKMDHALACDWCKTLCTMNVVTALCACGRLLNNLPQLDWPICSGSMAKT